MHQAAARPRNRRAPLTFHDLGGDPISEPLILVHATGLCGPAYLSFAARLTERFRIVAVDLPAHGDTPPPVDDDFSYDSFADDLAAAVAAAGLRGARVFGHSMGGAIALIAEARHPGTFRAAYVFEPAILAVTVHDDGAFIEMVRRRRARFASGDEVRESLLAKWPFAGCSTEAKDAMAAHLVVGDDDGVVLRCSPEHEARCYESHHWAAGDFAGLDLPVVIGSGGDDEYGAGLVPPPVAETIPGARMVVHPHLGHFGPLQDEALVAADVLAAL